MAPATPASTWRTVRGRLSPSLPATMRAIFKGMLGGLIGTLAMSAVMLAARALGLLGRLPPEQITQRALFPGRRRHTHRRAKNALAAGLHLAFGMGAGALFGPLQPRLPLARIPALQGATYGTLIWLLSYAGWAPALGLMPPASRDRQGRPATMVVAHWIFGATLALVVGRHAVRRPPRRSPRPPAREPAFWSAQSWVSQR